MNLASEGNHKGLPLRVARNSVDGFGKSAPLLKLHTTKKTRPAQMFLFQNQSFILNLMALTRSVLQEYLPQIKHKIP
ncbi:MAG: hypothetical protein ABFS56_28785, partial [Pseudomonadota bacterium]